MAARDSPSSCTQTARRTSQSDARSVRMDADFAGLSVTQAMERLDMPYG
jgi:hypothetical protein